MSKIIYIISESKDQTTNVIFDWLSYYNLEFKRIQDNFELFEIINSYLNQELCSIYFRKSLEKKEILKTDINQTIIKNHLEDELMDILFKLTPYSGHIDPPDDLVVYAA